jgi:hypothetical protein
MFDKYVYSSVLLLDCVITLTALVLDGVIAYLALVFGNLKCRDANVCFICGLLLMCVTMRYYKKILYTMLLFINAHTHTYIATHIHSHTHTNDTNLPLQTSRITESQNTLVSY